MRFDLDVHEADFGALLNQLVSITGHEPWTRKINSLQQQLDQNPYLYEYQNEHHSLELAAQDILSRTVWNNRKPVIYIQKQADADLLAFCAGITKIYDNLTPSAQRRLKGMILDGLKPDNNLLSVQHEASTAVHFISLGFDLEFNDLEKGSGVDFIGRLDGIELEIECKMFTGDIGRQLHRKKVLALQNYLSDFIHQIFNTANNGLLIRITIPGRLSCSTNQLDAIGQALKRGMVSGRTINSTEECEVEVLDFDINSSPFSPDSPEEVSKASLTEYVEKLTGRKNTNLMSFYSPKKKAVIVLMESSKPDKVLEGIYRQLRESSKSQFTKARPGHLAVQFVDLTAEQMTGLAMDAPSAQFKPTGLQKMTTEYLDSPSRSHIHSVTYRSCGILRQLTNSPNTFTNHEIAYYTRNPANPFYNDPRLKPLR